MNKNVLGEFLPLIIFFAVYKFSDLTVATICLILATIISFSYNYYKTKKINYTMLASSLFILIFGGLSIYFRDPKFIKIKPTIINLVFAGVLLVGIMRKKGYMSYLMGGAITMSEANWIRFSKRWCAFFSLSALLNELVWRNFSEIFWVKYKVFGSLILTFLFLMMNYKFLTHNGNVKANS